MGMNGNAEDYIASGLVNLVALTCAFFEGVYSLSRPTSLSELYKYLIMGKFHVAKKLD